jgi:hypothetical protein
MLCDSHKAEGALTSGGDAIAAAMALTRSCARLFRLGGERRHMLTIAGLKALPAGKREPIRCSRSA